MPSCATIGNGRIALHERGDKLWCRNLKICELRRE
jgi:hypothetical protein